MITTLADDDIDEPTPDQMTEYDKMTDESLIKLADHDNHIKAIIGSIDPEIAEIMGDDFMPYVRDIAAGRKELPSMGEQAEFLKPKPKKEEIIINPDNDKVTRLKEQVSAYKMHIDDLTDECNAVIKSEGVKRSEDLSHDGIKYVQQRAIEIVRLRKLIHDIEKNQIPDAINDHKVDTFDQSWLEDMEHKAVEIIPVVENLQLGQACIDSQESYESRVISGD